VSGTNLFAGIYGGGVFRSTSNGTNWTAVNNGLTNTSIRALAVSPDSSENLFAGTYGGGVFLSTNNGTNWTVVNNGLTNTNVNALAVSGTNLFVGTEGGVWRRPAVVRDDP
jgi:ligand-binding sensor domain-containing protein